MQKYIIFIHSILFLANMILMLPNQYTRLRKNLSWVCFLCSSSLSDLEIGKGSSEVFEKFAWKSIRRYRYFIIVLTSFVLT